MTYVAKHHKNLMYASAKAHAEFYDEKLRHWSSPQTKIYFKDNK